MVIVLSSVLREFVKTCTVVKVDEANPAGTRMIQKKSLVDAAFEMDVGKTQLSKNEVIAQNHSEIWP